MSNTVYCTVATEPQANSILTELRNHGLSPSTISVILPKRSDTKNIAVEGDVIRGAEAGGLAGEIAGWLAGHALFSLPGIGAFFIAGPLIAAFATAVAGGVVGGLAGGSGAIHPMELPAEVKDRIEKHLRHGDIVISVHSGNSESQERAAGIFNAAEANDIYYHSS